MGSRFDVSYSGTHRFDGSPLSLWEELKRVDMFETWWPWMKGVHLEGQALAPGSVISFTVDPPVPYTMDISVEVTLSERGRRIEGVVAGDLSGSASLELESLRSAALVHVRWDVELANRRIRAGILIARPLLLWAQRWAVEIALQGFRSHLRHLDD